MKIVINTSDVWDILIKWYSNNKKFCVVQEWLVMLITVNIRVFAIKWYSNKQKVLCGARVIGNVNYC